MSMSPIVIGSKMNDEAIIEAEIQQELQMINLDTENQHHEDNNEILEEVDPAENMDNFDIPEIMPKMEDYLICMRNQTDRFELELLECDELLNHHPAESSMVNEELYQMSQEMGEDPEMLKRKILEELEKEDELYNMDDSCQEETTLFITSEMDLLRKDQAVDMLPAEESDERQEVNDGALVVSDEISNLERFLHEQLKAIDFKYKEREERWKNEYQSAKVAEEEYMEARSIEHQHVFQKMKEEENMLLQEREITQQRLADEAEHNERQINEETRQFEVEINRMVGDLEREHSELQMAQRLTQERQIEKRDASVLAIQSWYRAERVRRIYCSVLKEKRLERQKLRELKRIEELELEREKWREEKEKVEEEKRKHKEEERRKIEEEIEKQKEAKRIKKEEEERMKKEEEERKNEEKKKKEEEERLKKEEDRKRKEEERKQKEEEKIKKKEEAERKKKEEAERKKKEDEERKRQAEEKKKREEERRSEEKRLKEEQKRIEEERKAAEKQKAEEEKKGREQKKKEDEEKRKAEEEKLKLMKSQDKDTLKIKEKEEKMNVNKHDQQMNNKRENVNNDPSAADRMKDRETAGIKSPDCLPTENKNFSSAAVLPEIVGGSFDFSKVPNSETLTPRISSNSLPLYLEAKRLTWIQECLPWSKVSNEPWKLKPATKKPPRRPSSAKKLPPLTDEIITAAARVATLRQVTTVSLSDLPGYSVTPLGQCWGLKCLTMNSCNLVTIEGLRDCRHLQYLHLKDNKIEYIDLKDLGSLQVVDLSHNSVSVLHGFDGCTNLRWLDLSHNRITRLDGLHPLRRLHTLLLSHNQLISAGSLEDTPTLQHVNLSHNHLQTVDSFNKLCLLQTLDLTANNLLKFPVMRNQVLLQECVLQDNSVSCVGGLQTYWLPLLTKLNMEQNSLNEIESIENCIMLKVFNIRNNQILDADHLHEVVSKSKYLEELYLHGNPITEEHIKGLFERHMPRLKILDGKQVNNSSSTSVCSSSDFELMCLAQIQMNVDLENHFRNELSSAKSIPSANQLDMCEIYFHYCDKSFQLAVEHRYAHEYGDVSVNVPKAPQTPKSGQTRAVRVKKKDEQVFLNPKDLFEKALKSGGGRDQHETALNENCSNAAGESKSGDLDEKRQMAAGRIQAFYKGYCVRREISQYTEQWMSAVVIQTAWRKYWARRKLKHGTGQLTVPRKDNSRYSTEQRLIINQLNHAATVIQAVWRGYILRLKLSAALEFARMQPDMDDDIDEFDMSQFNFDEESLEKGWRPSEIPQIPQSHAIVGKPPSGRKLTPDIPHLDLHPPGNPRHAWRNADSPLSDIKGRLPRPPSSIPSTLSLDTPHSVLSRKEERVSEEWGFHNTRTAALMLQRAKKMKYNADRRKKINSLDPHQRLALFRKLEETTKLNPIRAPARKVLPRKEYFQAKGELLEQQKVHIQQEIETRVHRTYEWLHTQVGSLDSDSTSNIQKVSSFGSESNLPKISSDVLAGNRMYLVNSPISLGPNESASGSEASHQRRFSLGTNSHTSGHSTHLPEIKTNSAGSKEKMSWRNKSVSMDVGWGGGKKRKGTK